MKSLKLLTLAVLIGFGANAQQGSWYIGGTLGFGSTKTTPNNMPGQLEMTTSNYNVSPEFGTWLTDDIQLGLGLNMNGTTNKTDGDKTFSNSNFNPVLYGRYYWRTPTALSFFVGLNFQMVSGGTTTYGAGDNGADLEGKISGFAGGVDAGIAYAISDRVGIMGRMGMAGFSNTKNINDKSDEDTYTQISQSGLLLNTLGPVFNIGLYYTFIN